MSKELGYVLLTPYTLRKARFGGVLSRLLSTTGLDFTAARIFGMSPDLTRRQAALIRSEENIPPKMRELLSDYVQRAFAPDEKGQRRRVLMLLFEGENTVQRLLDVIGGFEDAGESTGTIRGVYGDYIEDNNGRVTHFEPGVLAGTSREAVKNTLALWTEFSERDGGLIDRPISPEDREEAQKTLVIIKPDNFTFPSVRSGSIIDFFSRSGLSLIGAKVLRMSLAEAAAFYGPVRPVLQEKLAGAAKQRASKVLREEFGNGTEIPDAALSALSGALGPSLGEQQFYRILRFMTGRWTPDAAAGEAEEEGKVRCLTLVYAGKNAVEKIRSILGPTDPAKALPGSVRKEFGTDIMVNAAHASDSPENALREIGILKVEEDTLRRWHDRYFG